MGTLEEILRNWDISEKGLGVVPEESIKEIQGGTEKSREQLRAKSMRVNLRGKSKNCLVEIPERPSTKNLKINCLKTILEKF